VTNHLANIRAKLTAEELAHLKVAYGLDLGSPEHLLALSEFEQARTRLQVIEDRAVRQKQCHFCFGTVHSVGPLVRAAQGAQICQSCASACVSALSAATTELEQRSLPLPHDDA
jgi:hypothetical protein